MKEKRSSFSGSIGFVLAAAGSQNICLYTLFLMEQKLRQTGISHPYFHGLTVKRFLGILLDAMSQLFFSLSVSMGIMITYGSYVKNDIDLNKATNQIEIFDTGVAILAGMMIIPAVYVFLGNDGMASGPSLIFISLPKVFDAMGVFGRPAAIAFFLMPFISLLTVGFYYGPDYDILDIMSW